MDTPSPAHPLSFKKEGMLSDHIASTNIARRYVLRVEIKKKQKQKTKNTVETRERLEYLVTLNSKNPATYFYTLIVIVWEF